MTTHIPLIDLHRHLAGAITAGIVHKISRKHGLGWSFGDIFARMHSEERTFAAFLKRFDVFNEIPWDEADITTTLEHVIDGLHDENIRYAEVRFSINKYTAFTNSHIILFIARSLIELGQARGICLGLVLSIKYESMLTAIKCGSIDEIAPDIINIISGVDFVGNEAVFANFDHKKVRAYVELWRKAGREVLMHVGESCGCDNIKRAYYEYGVRRIVHGIRIVDDPGFMRQAAKDCIFYLSPTSNVETGVVDPHEVHPGRAMLDAGCTITIGTDDPAILRTNLRHEYVVARAMLRLTDDEIAVIKRNSILAALPPITEHQKSWRATNEALHTTSAHA
jgi:adenosine deaminase